MQEEIIMLYIMRHGRTDWNDAYKLQGRTDIPLNDAGRRMAQEAAQRYREVRLTSVSVPH